MMMMAMIMMMIIVKRRRRMAMKEEEEEEDEEQHYSLSNSFDANTPSYLGYRRLLSISGCTYGESYYQRG